MAVEEKWALQLHGGTVVLLTTSEGRDSRSERCICLCSISCVHSNKRIASTANDIEAFLSVFNS